jgi:hypothetical protein
MGNVLMSTWLHMNQLSNYKKLILLAYMRLHPREFFLTSSTWVGTCNIISNQGDFCCFPEKIYRQHCWSYDQAMYLISIKIETAGSYIYIYTSQAYSSIMAGCTHWLYINGLCLLLLDKQMCKCEKEQVESYKIRLYRLLVCPMNKSDLTPLHWQVGQVEVWNLVYSSLSIIILHWYCAW